MRFSKSRSPRQQPKSIGVALNLVAKNDGKNFGKLGRFAFSASASSSSCDNATSARDPAKSV